MKRVLAVLVAGLFAGGAAGADLMQVYQDALANDAKFSAADRKSTRLNSSHMRKSRMPSSA